MPSVRASLAVAVLAAVFALASLLDRVVLAGAVGLVVIIFALALGSAFDAKPWRWAAGLAGAAGLVALSWIVAEESSGAGPVAATLAVAFVGVIVIGLAYRGDRAMLPVSLMLGVTACVLAVFPAMWSALWESPEGKYSVSLAMLGVGVVGLLEMLPVSRAARRLAGVLVVALAASALVLISDQVSQAVPAASAVAVATVAGFMVAVSFAVLDRVVHETTPRDNRLAGVLTMTESNVVGLQASLPFIFAAPVAYVLGRIFIA